MAVVRGASSRGSWTVVMAVALAILLGSTFSKNPFAAAATTDSVGADSLAISPLEEQVNPDEYEIYSTLISLLIRDDSRIVFVRDTTDIFIGNDKLAWLPVIDTGDTLGDLALPYTRETAGLRVPSSIWHDLARRSSISYRLDHAPEADGSRIVLTTEDNLPAATARWLEQNPGEPAGLHSMIGTHTLTFSRAGFDPARTVAMVQWTDQCGYQRCGTVTSLLKRDGNSWTHLLDYEVNCVRLVKGCSYYPLGQDPALSTVIPESQLISALGQGSGVPKPAQERQPNRGPVPKLDMANVPALDHFYPPVSKRLGEEGTVVTQVLVDWEGHVLDVKIDKSCGFTHLDIAAINFAMMLHFLPFSSNKPVWTEYKVIFTLPPADATRH